MPYSVSPEIKDQVIDTMVLVSFESHDPEIWKGYLEAGEGSHVFTKVHRVATTENLLPWGRKSVVIRLEDAFDPEMDYSWNATDDDTVAREWIEFNLLSSIEVTEDMCISQLYEEQPYVWEGSRKFETQWQDD